MADRYVDFSAANDGDGTTAAQAASSLATGAYNTLSAKLFSANDKIWVRRVTSSALSPTLILSQTVVCEIIGWPINGDLYYSSRPASGTSNGWDSDSNTYSVLLFNSSSNKLSISGQNYKFYRISAQQNASGAVTCSISGTPNEFYDCYFFHNHATPNSGAAENDITSGSNLFVRCKWEASCNSNNANSSILKVLTGTNNKFHTCIVNVNSTAATGQAVWFTSADHLIHGLTINITAGTAALKILHLDSGANNIRGFDITITASGGVTTFIPLTIAGQANYITGLSTNAGGGGTSGFVAITGTNNFVMLSDFTQNPTTGTNGINFTTGSNNHVVLKNGTFQGNTQDINLSTGQDNTVLCNNVIFSSSPIVAASYHETSKFWSYNHGQTAGAFKHIHLHGEINASNTYRIGGESFSFKFEALTAGTAERGQLQLGIPGFETIWLSLLSGSRTITLYGAHKSFGGSPPLSHHIWFEIEYLDVGGKYHHYSTYAYGTSLTSDSSTWNNDSSLTAFKIAATVTVNADCIVSARIYYFDYVASAYLYIDPKFEVT